MDIFIFSEKESDKMYASIVDRVARDFDSAAINRRLLDLVEDSSISIVLSNLVDIVLREKSTLMEIIAEGGDKTSESELYTYDQIYRVLSAAQQKIDRLEGNL